MRRNFRITSEKRRRSVPKYLIAKSPPALVAEMPAGEAVRNGSKILADLIERAISASADRTRPEPTY